VRCIGNLHTDPLHYLPQVHHNHCPHVPNNHSGSKSCVNFHTSIEAISPLLLNKVAWYRIINVDLGFEDNISTPSQIVVFMILLHATKACYQSHCHFSGSLKAKLLVHQKSMAHLVILLFILHREELENILVVSNFLNPKVPLYLPGLMHKPKQTLHPLRFINHHLS